MLNISFKSLFLELFSKIHFFLLLNSFQIPTLPDQLIQLHIRSLLKHTHIHTQFKVHRKFFKKKTFKSFLCFLCPFVKSAYLCFNIWSHLIFKALNNLWKKIVPKLYFSCKRNGNPSTEAMFAVRSCCYCCYICNYGNATRTQPPRSKVGFRTLQVIRPHCLVVAAQKKTTQARRLSLQISHCV